MSLRRMLPFLLLNIIVSASVVLLVLTLWERRDSRPDDGTPVAETATAGQTVLLPTPVVAATPTGAVVEGAPVQDESSADDAPVVHTVRAGDTLNVIAQQYGVSVEDIATVNQLTNINILSVGQELLIPVNGIPEPTAEAPAVEPTAALPTPIPPAPAAATGQAAIEITQVTAAGALAEEAILISNGGSSEQPMEGWKLRDEDGNVYTFGQVRIYGEGSGVTIYSRPGENTATALFWGLDAAAWRPGELATLWDANDQVVARFTIP